MQNMYYTWTVYFTDINNHYRELCTHVSAPTEAEARFKVNKEIGPNYHITKIFKTDSANA